MTAKGNKRHASADWILLDEQKRPISNFIPVIINCIDVYLNGKDEPQSHIKLYLCFKDGQRSQEMIEPLINLAGVDWLSKDSRVRLCPQIPKSKANQFIEDYIRFHIINAPHTTAYRVGQLGTHLIEGGPVFCTGGGIICPLPGPEKRADVTPIPMPFNLDIDPNLGEEEAVAGMLELISLSPDAGRTILAHTLLYLMRQVYADTWKSPCCCVFLYGKTGTKKTTYAALLTQVYNRKKGIATPPRLDASIPAAVDILYEKDDCVVVLDDLFPAESNNMRHHQETTLFEITRIVADGVEPARMRGKTVSKESPTCGVLFTGEYNVGTGSDAARLLSVELFPSPNGDSLKRFQDEILLVSTFYQFFISWYISHYYNIQEFLKIWREAYSKVQMDVHDRLKETHFFLNTAYILLLQYSFEKKYISESEAKVLQGSFQALLTDLVQKQQLRVVQSKLPKRGQIDEYTKTDYLERIRVMYKKGSFRLADTATQFNDRDHDGVIHNNCLFLRGRPFKENFHRYFPATNFNNIINVLLAQNVLNQGNDKVTKQIYDCGGKRFYAIPLEKLQ